VVDGTGAKIEGRGDLQNCQACHFANKETDYVFRTYFVRSDRKKVEMKTHIKNQWT